MSGACFELVLVLGDSVGVANDQGRIAEALAWQPQYSRDVLALSERHTHATLLFSTPSDSLPRFDFTAVSAPTRQRERGIGTWTCHDPGHGCV